MVGGSVAQFDDLLRGSTRRAFASIETYAADPEIRFSRAGDFGGAIGAALLESRWYGGVGDRG